jgi:peptide deformylase
MNIIAPPLKIVQYPHAALRHPARPILSLDRNVIRIAEAMIELMHEHKGLGLAAPQVGLPFRMFVANFPGDKDQPDQLGVFINPQIDFKSNGTVEGEEGCLSFPGLYRKVRRARSVEVQAHRLDVATGQTQAVALTLRELPARVWQHETDHLDGILFIDKLGPIGKMTVRSTLAEFERDYRKAQKKGDIPPDAEIEKLLAALEESGPPDITPRQAS